MTFAYYAGPDAVKGLRRSNEKGEKVLRNVPKSLQGIVFLEFYKKVAAHAGGTNNPAVVVEID